MSLNYYLGKVCTVMVNPTALPTDHYNEKQVMLQFTGIVEYMDNKGLQLVNLAYKTKSFFFFPNIIALCEEQVLNEDDPQVEVLKEAMTKQKEENPEQNNDSAFIDIKSLQNIAAQSKS